MAKTPRKTVEQLQEEHRAGARRIAAFIQHKATQHPNTMWADPVIPYQQLIQGAWLREDLMLPMLDKEAWMNRVRGFTDTDRVEFREITDSTPVAQLLLYHDLGSVDVELLGEMTTSDHEMAEPYSVFRVGSDRVYAYGGQLCGKDDLLQEAAVLRGTAHQVEILANL